MPDLATLLAAARSLASTGMGWAAADPKAPASPLWPGEAIGKAVPARVLEFAAGRATARTALAALAVAPAAIPQAPDRAPIWPDGISGSITHSPTLCLAAVTHLPRRIGIDLEPITPLSRALWETVLLPSETAAISAAGTPALNAKLIFSAKEAAYKAQYQRSQTLMGFQGLEVTLLDNRFIARFTQSVPGFAQNTCLHGHFCQSEGHFLTLAFA